MKNWTDLQNRLIKAGVKQEFVKGKADADGFPALWIESGEDYETFTGMERQSFVDELGRKFS